jgi:hypothetical protein
MKRTTNQLGRRLLWRRRITSFGVPADLTTRRAMATPSIGLSSILDLRTSSMKAESTTLTAKAAPPIGARHRDPISRS